MIRTVTNTMSISISSYKRQQLLLEFAAIKTKCPDGIYLSPAPANPTSWSGVFFVRQGPYSGIVLRFEITFPESYPEIGPSLSFATEVFHPLLVPLTTYTFAAGALDPNATLSSGDTERLPPGSFNLREHFSDWYTSKTSQSDTAQPLVAEPLSTRRAGDANGSEVITTQTEGTLRIVELLEYVKQAFEDAAFLDSLPLRAAVNTNAWHAWRAHRGLPRIVSRSISPASAESGRTPLSPGRTPGDWNWDGVWESRVKNAMEESTSDAVLFGSKSNRAMTTSSGHIRFAKNDDDQTREIQEAMMQAIGIMPVQS